MPVVLPPGPRAPVALQTLEWVVRPTALMRRCAARHGDPFTLRTSWADAPMVFVSDPAEIRKVFAADPGVLRAGEASEILEPFAGARSILLLDGAEHMRQRKLMLPPFHGARMAAHRETVTALAAEEVARWPAGEPFAALPRMQALTLEVIMRVVFGLEQGPELTRTRDAIRGALDIAASLPRLMAMTLVRRELGPRSPWAVFNRAVGRMDELLYELIEGEAARGSILAELKAARHEDGSPPSPAELRDQLATLLAAGHETTAGALAWGLERLARSPDAQRRLRDDDGDPAYADAVVKEVLRVRPVLTIVTRKSAAPYRLAGWTLPAGVHVAVCVYLAHRRTDAYPDPTAFRPERWLADPPPPSLAWVPFGGGIRRCLGAAFATMEMREVLRAVVGRVVLAPERPASERPRRRSITLTPAHGARVLAHPR